MKSILKANITRTILAWLLHKYSLFAWYTNRVTWINRETLETLSASDQPILALCWHGRLAFAPFFAKHPSNVHAVISRHGDGALIARILGFYKIQQVRGSTNRPASDPKGAKDRGGSQALRETLSVLQEGNIVVITPDGPRGPRMHLQGNILTIAQKTGAAIIPLTFASSRCKIFNSWDHFMLPLPFGKTIMITGDPATIPDNADEEMVENTRIELENQLNKITRQADETMGLEPIQPA